jgi:hypothetical protein
MSLVVGEEQFNAFIVPEAWAYSRRIIRWIRIVKKGRLNLYSDHPLVRFPHQTLKMPFHGNFNWFMIFHFLSIPSAVNFIKKTLIQMLKFIQINHVYNTPRQT